MQRWPLLVTGLICVLFFPSCRKSASDDSKLTGPPQVGATYVLNDGEGGFRAAKVVAVEDKIVFVLLSGARWSTQPSTAAMRKATNSTPVAYSAESFSGMQPLQLENGSVSTEELEAYEAWKLRKGEVF